LRLRSIAAAARRTVLFNLRQSYPIRYMMSACTHRYLTGHTDESSEFLVVSFSGLSGCDELRYYGDYREGRINL
jgi:hypothetical protein